MASEASVFKTEEQQSDALVDPPVRSKPLATILGRRTTTGEISLAEPSIVDCPDLDKVHRERLHSDNAALHKHNEAIHLRTNSAPVDMVVVQDSSSGDVETISTSWPGENGAMRVSSSGSQGNDNLKGSSSDDDEELQRARAMALAIQNHPNMTPDEIRELLAKQDFYSPAVGSKKTTQAPAPLIPGRLTNLMFSSTTTLMSTATAPAARGSINLGVFGEKARKGLNEMLSGSEKARKGFNDILTGSVSKLEDMTATINGSMKKDLPLPTSTTSSSSKDAGVLRLPFLHINTKAARSPPTSPHPTDRPQLVTSLPNAVLPFGESSHQSLSADATQPSAVQKAMPIRMSGLAWKRRGGMGKFSTTAAWERRRIELQGTKILYYLRDASEEDLQGASEPRDDYASIANVTSLLTDDGQDCGAEGVVVTKRTNWLEQAASSWVAGSDDPTAPRGYIDLAKEKATVQASMGDSGAPSPFAISIKVRGETKWKLCFDYHRTQMEWLMAIADVVVQTSVDNYNACLLQAADPSYQSENILFHPPLVGLFPSSRDSDNSHRLWMTEPYTVSSSNTDKIVEGNEQTETLEPDLIDQLIECDESLKPVDGGQNQTLDMDGARWESIIDSASKAWTIPEKNIFYVFGVLNVALAYARASSTSTEGFWYLVTLANLGVYLCLNHGPEWQSILKISRALSADAKPAVKTLTKTTKQRPIVQVAAAPVESEVKSEALLAPETTAYIPVAGCSTVRLENPLDPPVNSKNQFFAAWRVEAGETLLVRSHGYLTTKEKVPSPGEMYDCVAVDIFESPQRYPDMAPRVKLPKVDFEDTCTTKTWRAPDIFIISIALPTDPPKLGQSTSDGGGYTLTMYYRMKQETRDILKRVTAEGYDPSTEVIDDPQKSKVNAVRLLDEWCRRAPMDPAFQSRFKIVPNAQNLKEIGMPYWISKYNGKPFLIKRPGQTGFLYSHPELSCMEFDVSLHPFPYLAKQAICFMKESFFKKVLVTFGFVIEGRAEDELPECLIGLTQFCYPDPLYAVQAEDFFAGTCPRSF